MVRNSIAILPFVNLSHKQEEDYFSDGITEEIIAALSRIEELDVTARTSSFALKNTTLEVREIGKRLGVLTLLEGSVRRAGTKIRISTQLVRCSDAIVIWHKRFDRELTDIFALQDEISLHIAEQVREHFGHFEIQEQLIQEQTINVAAYELYLKGRYHQLKWNPADLKLAIHYYEATIEKDPSFSLPYFGAALTYAILASWSFIPHEEGNKKAHDLLATGSLIDEETYLGYGAKATLYFWGEWKFKEGHFYLQKAVGMLPLNTDAEEGLAELYTAIGEFDRALIHVENVLSINPLSPNHYYTKGNIFYRQKKFKEAIKYFELALECEPRFALAMEMIALCYVQLKNKSALREFLARHPEMNSGTLALDFYKLLHEAHIPNQAFFEDLKGRHVLVPWMIYFYVYANQHKNALQALKEGVANRVGQLINFANDPLLEPLRSKDAYKSILEAVFNGANLPNIGPVSKKSVSKDKALLTKEEAQHFLQRLNVLMDIQKLYTSSDLSLKDLAKQLKLHPNKLSWLLNEHVHKNFNEFINNYRTKEFKRLALLPENKHITLLGLAYESGFNSKTVFNAYFKKSEGLTPKAWLVAQKSSEI